MRKICIIMSIVLILCSELFAQSCLPNGITFNSQLEIDDFANNFPGCTQIEGDVTITSEINNLNGLNPITTIGGTLFINSEQLTNLNGLEQLTSVGGLLRIIETGLIDLEELGNLETIGDELAVFGNAKLISLNGLENLNYIGTHVFISQNDSLQDISILENFTKINGELVLGDNPNLLDLSGFQNIDTIGENLIFSFFQHANLTGLENVKFIGGDLSVSFSDSLKSLDGLDNLDTLGGGLFFYENDSLLSLSSLENLTAINEALKIERCNELTSITGLQNINRVGGEVLFCLNDKLEDLSLSSLTEIATSLRIKKCNNLQTLQGLESLETVGTGIPPTGLITDFISIDDNANLNDISALENTNLSDIYFLDIKNNPNLAICDYANICNFLWNDGIVGINNNAAGCQNELEVKSLCEDKIPKIKFNVFYDYNENKIFDTNEVILTDVGININLEEILYPISTNGGIVFFSFDEYDFSLDLNSYPNWELTTDSTSFHVVIDTFSICDTINFGLYPSQFISSTTSFINGPPARCGEFKTFQTHVKNLGTTQVEGTLWLEVDENISATSFIDIPDTIVMPNRYGWHFDSLFPGYSISKKIDLQIPAPPNVVIGDSLYFNSFTDFTDINGATSSSNFYYATEVRCSFDPNDKLVNPSRSNNFTLFDEELIYTIRFQNTGNDEAYDIIIEDILDENLDPTTFRILSTSHPDVLITNLIDNQFLTFSFENIYLPDSTTDFEASQGFVSYLIKPKNGLLEETNIYNTASIYFDFNPPIITNTTQNIMVSELPTSVFYLGGKDGIEVTIFPNPVSDFLFITKEKTDRLLYEIIDVNGRNFEKGELTNLLNKVDVTKIDTGIYFFKIMNPKTEEYFITKIIK